MQPYSYPSLSPIPLALAKALRVSDAKLVKGDGGKGRVGEYWLGLERLEI